MSYRYTILAASSLLSVGIIAQGVALALTENQVNSSQITQESENYPLLKLGAKGDAVKKLQTELQQEGYFVGAIDGDYGQGTKLAVSQFQKTKNLPIDGIVGEQTWKLLLENNPQPMPKTSLQERTDIHNLKVDSDRNQQNQMLLWGIGIVTAVVGVGGVAYFVTRGSQEIQSQGIQQEELIPQEINLSVSTSQIKPLKITQPEEFIPISTPSPSQPEVKENSTKSNLTVVEEAPLTVEQPARLAKVDLVQDLIHDLQKSDRGLRRKAIWGLAQQGDSRAMEPLVQMMLEVDSQERSLILEAVSQISARTLKPLNRALNIALQDNNSQVRKNAIRDMTRVYELMSQMNQRLSMAINDSDDDVKETAKWALGQLSELRKLPGLEQLARN